MRDAGPAAGRAGAAGPGSSRWESWRLSPQQVDPLSWFTGPQLALVLGAVSLLQAVAAIVLLWDHWPNPAAQLAALPFFAFAAVQTSVLTRANRHEFRSVQGFGILGVALLGLLVSAGGTLGGAVHPEFWWATVSIAMVLSGFAPFSSARQLLAYSVPLVAVVAVVGQLAFRGTVPMWQPFGTVIIVAAPVLIAAVASVVFVVSLVDRSRDALEAGTAEAAAHPEGVEVDDAGPENETVARTRDQVEPFLRRLAAVGRITAADRLQAANLAAHLRTDLVTAANRSWLETVAQQSGLVVSDPTGLADRMDQAQRAALRGLLLVVMDNPVVDHDSLRIELRAQDDGSTAVALSLDVDLPEGRRILLLAPYYLTLKMTVDNLRWADGRSVLFRFQIPSDRTD